jgi:hypothetical protein
LLTVFIKMNSTKKIGTDWGRNAWYPTRPDSYSPKYLSKTTMAQQPISRKHILCLWNLAIPFLLPLFLYSARASTWSMTNTTILTKIGNNTITAIGNAQSTIKGRPNYSMT